jgi:hypothetical protein
MPLFHLSLELRLVLYKEILQYFILFHYSHICLEIHHQLLLVVLVENPIKSRPLKGGQSNKKEIRHGAGATT